jgi:DNA polymerase alpha-associated DNA helicase A
MMTARAHSMHAKIASFPSRVMYHAKLTSHLSVAGHLLKDLPNTGASSEDEEMEILGTPVAFFDTAGCEYFERTEGEGDEGSRCNENEAMVVKRYVEQLVSTIAQKAMCRQRLMFKRRLRWECYRRKLL